MRLPLQEAAASVSARDGHGADDGLGLGLRKVDMQESVQEACARDLHALGQHEVALELSGGDAAMQEHAGLVRLLLPTPHHQLVVLDGDVEIFA